MYFLQALLPWILVCVQGQIVLLAQPFALDGESNGVPNSVKLSWTLSNARSYQIERKDAGQDFARVASVPGNAYDDYDLKPGAYAYRVTPSAGDSHSNVANVNIASSGTGLQCSFYDNTKPSELVKQKSKFFANGTFYQYSIGNGNVYVSKSTDGYSFAGQTIVLAEKTLCAGSPDGGCKLESVAFSQNPHTKEIVLWAHWEFGEGYAAARVASAYGRLGDRMTFVGSFRPLGAESRDLGFFIDESNESKAYLLSATNGNSDLAIYELDSDWHKVKSKVTTVLIGQHREAPALVHESGVYYLFTSRAAGWYPSEGTYISATSLSGPWSDQRDAGHIATFGAQSGGTGNMGVQYMAANRWAAEWRHAEASNRQILMPISFSGGHAVYQFYPKLCYNLDQKTMHGIQEGKVVSVGKPVTSSATKDKLERVVDGVVTDPTNLYDPGKTPFWIEVDLQLPTAISRIELSTALIGGSEHYYQFNVTGSTDGRDSVLLLDQTHNTVVGFVTAAVRAGSKKVRRVRLHVSKVANVQNDHEDNNIGVSEFKIYGEASE